jgi:MoxR-like ATPase
VQIVRTRAPEVSEELTRQVVALVQQLRDDPGLVKPPGVAETLDWARALHRLGTTDLDLGRAAATLGALVKYREDTERVRHALARVLER